MDSNHIRAAELRIWETICAAQSGCEIVEFSDPWRKVEATIQLPVGRNGEGLLGWIPEARMKKLRSVASGPVEDDKLQLILINTATQTVAVKMTLMIRSSWSRLGIPMTKALAFPEGIILSMDEAEEVRQIETDFYGLWLVDGQGRSRVLAFDSSAYTKLEVLGLGKSMVDQAFLADYFRLGGLSDRCPRHTKSYSLNNPPTSNTLVVPREHDTLLRLPREHTRLFKEHRVFAMLNWETPIQDLIKESP
jgi:hypothetical protein